MGDGGLSVVGQYLFAGLAIGGVYALVALGIVLIYRATNVVNFAQGEFAMLGAYAMVTLWQGVGLDYNLGGVFFDYQYYAGRPITESAGNVTQPASCA